MKTKLFILALTAGLTLLNHSTFACGGPVISASLRPLAEKAVSQDPAIASSAIASLRAQGPAGLNALLVTHSDLIEQHNKNALPPAQQGAWQRLQLALDAVSAQRDCSASHLFWYTNLDDAKVAAKSTGKPILSLRLLGKLDEEYSCANSRFFRTTLYANTEVSQYLRDHFVLHWKSVRPVPRITIDFGDGRKIERTITGNSIHYVLNADGRPLDALPGLYGPKAFLKGLVAAEAAAQKFTALSADQKSQFLRQYHTERFAATQQAWQNDMLALGQSPLPRAISSSSPPGVSAPTAMLAANRAIAKSATEVPILKSFRTADDATWSRVANLHKEDSVLDLASVSLIASKNPTATDAGRVAMTKWQAESPLTATLRNLQRSIAEDTVRNEYLLHSQIHEWFINSAAPENSDQFNSLVYAKLFLTPDSDPWLGLVSPNTFTGLDNNGLVQISH